MRTNERNKGFTLLEILLVILILGMLAGVLIVAIGGAGDKARIDTTRLTVTMTVPDALERYKFDIGHYPSEEEGGLKALITKPSFSDETLATKWSGPYLKQEPLDAWNKPLNYEVATDSTDSSAPKFKVWSNGPNGNSGDEDDIKSWKEETGG